LKSAPDLHPSNGLSQLDADRTAAAGAAAEFEARTLNPMRTNTTHTRARRTAYGPYAATDQVVRSGKLLMP
jgi:hypothetical protein